MRIGTRPRSPSTMRTTSVRSPHVGMKSTTRTAPVAVSNSVSRISVLVAIPSRRPAHRPRGREQPAAVLGRAQQRAEARGVVEARHAQPVDRAVAARRAPRCADCRSARSPRWAGPRDSPENHRGGREADFMPVPGARPEPAGPVLQPKCHACSQGLGPPQLVERRDGGRDGRTSRIGHRSAVYDVPSSRGGCSSGVRDMREGPGSTWKD